MDQKKEFEYLQQILDLQERLWNFMKKYEALQDNYLELSGKYIELLQKKDLELEIK